MLFRSTIEVFRRLSHKRGKTKSAILKLSGFSSVEVLTWPLVLILNAYAKNERCFGQIFVSFLSRYSGAARFGFHPRQLADGEALVPAL